MKNKLYYIVPFLHVLIIVYASAFFITETNDTKDYYNIAASFPVVKNSMFPLLYPLSLKLVNIFFSDFFVSSKVLNVISILSSLMIARKYLKEWKVFWIFTLTWVFFPIITYSWSEILLIPLTLLLFVSLRNLFYSQGRADVITVLLVLLFLTKYSLISISIATLTISLVSYIKSKERKYKQLAIGAIISISVCAIYLLCNYYVTGFLTGNRAALGPVKTNLRLSLFHTLQSFNPLFSNIIGRRTPYIIVVLIALVFMGSYFKRIKLIIAMNIKPNLLFIFLGLFYLIFLWTTYFFIRIDVLSIRLLFPFYLMFFIGLFINPIKIKYINLIVVLILLNLARSLFVKVFYLHNYF